jgi:hypothetical protein
VVSSEKNITGLIVERKNEWEVQTNSAPFYPLEIEKGTPPHFFQRETCEKTEYAEFCDLRDFIQFSHHSFCDYKYKAYPGHKIEDCFCLA